MKYLFIVQTEGRGHLSQAMALADLLEASQHEICSVFIGKSHRTVPMYFLDRFANKFQWFESPNFSYEKNQQGLHLRKTLWHNLSKVKTFCQSIAWMRREIVIQKPDIVINFYDLLGGLVHWNFTKRHQYVVISHHFYLTHSKHKLLKGRTVETLLLKTLNKFTSWKADKILALSFRPEVASKSIRIIPPLIQKEILEAIPMRGDYLLAYSVNRGYSDQLRLWQQKHPEIIIHYFWDGPQSQDCEEVQKNLYFHRLDRLLFIQYLTLCNGFVSTAGFEGICEAIYLAKPVLVVPVANHLEQANNALDALKTGNCMVSDTFELDEFLKFVQNDFSNEHFKLWVDSANSLIIAGLIS